MTSARAQVDWVRVPLDPKLLKDLNQSSDFQGWLQAGGHFLLWILSGTTAVVIWATQPWYWLIPALLVHGVVHRMLSAGCHELSHERVFRTPALNRFFRALLGFFTFWNYPFYAISHKDHHRFTLNRPHDLEVILPSASELRKTKPESRWQRYLRYSQWLVEWNAVWPTIKLHRDFAKGGYPHNDMPGGIYSQAWCEHLFSRMDDRDKRAIRNWSRIVLLGHAAILVGSSMMGWWIIPLVVTFSYFIGSGVAVWLGEPQHAGLADGVDDFRLSCRTYTCSKVLQFLYWNMNYHIEHHMYAAVPCYNLPKLHAAIREHLPPVHTSLYSVWCEIRQTRFRQRWDPTYRYTQPLPEQLPSGEHLTVDHVEDTSATDYLDLVTGERPEAANPADEWKVWECNICGFLYDEALGMPDEGIAPGTRWDDIPDDWVCPDCGVAKADFSMIERTRVATSASPASADDASANDEHPVIIIGAGMAGYTLAREFRQHNNSQEVLILTRDGGESYYKPLLSNALARDKTREALINKRAEQMASELDVKVKTDVVVEAIDRDAKTLSTTAGVFSYSSLVLATGADQRKLPLTGNAVDDVIAINNLADYEHFRSRLPDGGSVVIIGAGLIGCEFANDLIESGYEVAILDLALSPLGTLIPVEVGNALKDRLTAKGVNWCLGVSVSSVDREGDRLCCTLSDGSTLNSDLVLSAVGLIPSTDLARAAGLDVGSGIITDEFLRTSDPSIYALGDCAEVNQHVRQFIAPLRLGAIALARTLAGVPSALRLPAMPIQIKTPACPIVTLKPDSNVQGSWRVIDHRNGLECHYVDAQERLRGFALTEGMIDRKEDLLSRITA